jgi:hypothetical protein
MIVKHKLKDYKSSFLHGLITKQINLNLNNFLIMIIKTDF